MDNIIVVGSINMDLVVRTDRAPVKGETLPGMDYRTIPGGKGANQAVAAAKLGGQVYFVGRVGNDGFGEKMLQAIKSTGIYDEYIFADPESTTGIAFIVVESTGDNRIIIVPGANARVSPEDVGRAFRSIHGAQALILQFEIPLETAFFAVEQAGEKRIPVFLNAAPAYHIPDNILNKVDFLIVNETELGFLSGGGIADKESGRKAARTFLDKGVGCVVLTMGAKGAMAIRRDECLFAPPFEAEVIDTTAAGDSFIGGFVTAWLESRDIAAALRTGNAAGALATTKIGAQTSIPTKEEVLLSLNNFPPEVVERL